MNSSNVILSLAGDSKPSLSRKSELSSLFVMDSRELLKC